MNPRLVAWSMAQTWLRCRETEAVLTSKVRLSNNSWMNQSAKIYKRHRFPPAISLLFWDSKDWQWQEERVIPLCNRTLAEANHTLNGYTLSDVGRNQIRRYSMNRLICLYLRQALILTRRRYLTAYRTTTLIPAFSSPQDQLRTLTVNVQFQMHVIPIK